MEPYSTTLVLASYQICEIHPWCYLYHYLRIFHCCVAFHCIEIPQIIHLLLVNAWFFPNFWLLTFCCRKGDLFQGLRVGSCPTLGNELSEESHMLRKQESLLRRDAWEESRRVREPRRTAAPCGSQSWVLWWWGSFLGFLWPNILTRFWLEFHRCVSPNKSVSSWENKSVLNKYLLVSLIY